MTTTEHKPSDHILDDFLASQGLQIKGVSLSEFRTVMQNLRAAFAAERDHDAYELAKTAITAIDVGEGSEHYRHGRETMQADALRRIDLLREGASS